MQKNKIAGWLGGITLAVSLVACGDKTVVTESSVIEEEVAEKEVAEENVGKAEMTEKPEGEAPEGMPQRPEGEALKGMPQKPEGNPPQGMPGEAPPGASDMPGGANGAPGEMPGTGGGAESSSIETKGVTEIAEDATWKDATYSSEEADVSAVVVTDGGNVSLSAVEINKSGDVSNREASEFYGLNAAFLVKRGSSATITDSTVITDAEGANAIFATGENAKIEVSNLTIETKGDSSRGLDATYGGTIIADTVTITTQGAHCAALATDRGEGTIEVTNGSFQTSGEGSPCIYSTGNIHVTDSEGIATGSAIAVVEGKNTIYVEGSTLEGYGIGRAGGGIDDTGVMVYQSMSGDAGVGTGNFTAVNSRLSISEESDKYAASPMFFVTNTDAVIELTNTELNFGSGILLSASGNDGEWGRVGENGGDVEFNAKDQTLNGDVITDAISSVALTLENSTLEGCINGENKGDVTVILDSASKWTVTGDSYVSVLTNEDKTCANIISNGNCIYYDADNSVNDWLNGETIPLSGGGALMPVE